jgi:hypothetical protein
LLQLVFLDGAQDAVHQPLYEAFCQAAALEIRAYGVTTCFRTEATEGKCLRRGTRLPDDTRMLLAKGPAAKGRLMLPLVGYGGTDQLDGWCAAAHWAEDDGPPIYSIVIAAYDQNGHSAFAIVAHTATTPMAIAG